MVHDAFTTPGRIVTQTSQMPDGRSYFWLARTTVPIGAGCKVCDRPACPQRAFPQLGRSIHVDAAIADSIPYRPDPA